jgi:hypothetical protein
MIEVIFFPAVFASEAKGCKTSNLLQLISHQFLVF